MSKMKFRGIVASVIVGVTCIVTSATAYAQTSPTADNGAAPTKAQIKAARKEERKANRVAKNVELSRLEKNGYHPGSNDPSYPAKLQAAQKKAGTQ